MYLFMLTLILCLSTVNVIVNLEDNFILDQYEDEQPYNIYKWIKNLQLQTCALVAIGLKYFAIFVENITDFKNGTLKSTIYFLGICHQSTLEQWSFCSDKLDKKRKYKCRFKLKAGIYQNRVHRRFCDLNVMVKNKDCSCSSSFLEAEMFKVRGLPTCYISPLPYSLCKYNVCGLSKCSSSTIDCLVHAVRCDSNCTTGNPFCEGPLARSSSPPKINSQWSKWNHLKSDIVNEGESRRFGKSSIGAAKSKKRRSVATCINKYTSRPDLDCLGPGTGCFSDYAVNCNCKTYEEDEALKVERTCYHSRQKKRPSRDLVVYPIRRTSRRFLRDIDDDMEDDDDDNEDLNEDIILEEDTTETTLTTTETLEKEELKEQVENNLEEEIENIRKNNTLSNARLKNNAHIQANINKILICLLTNILLLNKGL